MDRHGIFWDTDLPAAPARIFLIGIGGIGMSSLAQLLLHCGYEVQGSDRGLDDSGKQELYRQLREMGMEIHSQDGSGARQFVPEAVVCSAAIEPGNADLAALPPGCPVIHRARALSGLLCGLDCPLITVAGSCGKTSVCGWLSSAIQALGHDILMVNGGYSLDFATEKQPGNFHADAAPEYLIAEVDESDRSIREFTPDYSILLNVGNDHYDRAELEKIFGAYLRRTVRGSVLPENLMMLAPSGRKILTFTDMPSGSESPAPLNYCCSAAGIEFQAGGQGPQIRSSQSGFHSAMNALAVLQMLKMVFPAEAEERLARALEAYHGVKQRFELMSRPGAFPVINDYAHNPEKITAALTAARERFGGPLLAVFQPHGYGPWGFMRQALGEELHQCLEKDDLLLILPVYYAGGTSSFTPSSEEVAEEFATDGLPVTAVAGRTEAEQILLDNRRKAPDQRCLLVMGARDASLREWSRKLADMTADAASQA